MRTLRRTLEDHDPGHLRILAELWGIELPPGSVRQSAQALSRTMLERSTTKEIIDGLAPRARRTLEYVQRQGDQAPLADLTRMFGPLREMGPGRRDREKPWRSPASPLEILWYRGLIARAFADTETGPQEFVFIPSDLSTILPRPAPVKSQPPGQPADPPPVRLPASSAAVDDATTLLAALRRRPIDGDRLSADRRQRLKPFLLQPEALDLMLYTMVHASILADSPLSPDQESTRNFLEASRAEALETLLLTWLHTQEWNDLQHVPDLSYADEVWPNDPRVARQAILRFLHHIPLGAWWDLEQFILDIREQHPAFQRPAGDFSSWYFRHTETDTILHGFEHWEHVDGALLRYLITGPLHWLGATDLGKLEDRGPVKAFRLTPAVSILFDPDASLTIKESEAFATLHADGRIRVPRRALRTHRYQIARFTRWESIGEESYRYRIIPSSLQLAAEQGLESTHVQSILESAVGKPLPASLIKALDRWSELGSEARIERRTVLRVQDPSTLELLRENRSTARFLKEALGPTTVVVLENDWESLCAAAARLGLLIDPPFAEQGPFP